MAHTGDVNVEVGETQRETRATKAKRASSRDRMSTLEDKVECLEDGARDAVEKLDVVDGRLDELETKGDELKDDVNIAINKAMEDVDKKGDAFQVALAALREELQGKIEKLEVGHGQYVSFWFDNWVPDLGPLTDYVATDRSTLLRDRSVASFAMDSGEWRWCELEQLLPPHVLLRLAAIKCPLPCFDNAKVRWSRANDLHFTVKSAYLILNVECTDVADRRAPGSSYDFGGGWLYFYRRLDYWFPAAAFRTNRIFLSCAVGSALRGQADARRPHFLQQTGVHMERETGSEPRRVADNSRHGLLLA
ncbi:hypothetical protein V6N12_013192 [Hibiscus sabdariffa]|uniref:Uncharacterized protein n=1 Tax=Hibiscus sabdariffa TaxID=183260 RepID=A0ABR2D5T2_9ROSI